VGPRVAEVTKAQTVAGMAEAVISGKEDEHVGVEIVELETDTSSLSLLT
jgi:hypothetical protein